MYICSLGVKGVEFKENVINEFDFTFFVKGCSQFHVIFKSDMFSGFNGEKKVDILLTNLVVRIFLNMWLKICNIYENKNSNDF